MEHIKGEGQSAGRVYQYILQVGRRLFLAADPAK